MKMNILSLILVINFICCCNRNITQNDIILNTLKELNVSDVKNTIIIFVPTNTCMGCRKHAYEILKTNEYLIKVIFITSDVSLISTPQENVQLIIDKKKIIDHSPLLKEKITIYFSNYSNSKIIQLSPASSDSIQYYLETFNNKM